MNLFIISKKDLKLAFMDVSSIVFLFITPIIVITIASFALSGLFQNSSGVFKVPVIVEDDHALASKVVSALEKTGAIDPITTYTKGGRRYPMDIQEAKSLLPRRKAAIIIPRGFGENIQKGKTSYIYILEDPSDRVIPSVVNSIVTSVISRYAIVSSSMKVTTSSINSLTEKIMRERNIRVDPRDTISKALDEAETLGNNPPVLVEGKINLDKNAHRPTPFENNVPGYAVMFILFSTSLSAGSLLMEKEQGTLGRLRTMPVSAFELLGGKLLANFIIAMLQSVLLFSVGHLVFGMWLGKDVVALVILIITVCFAATGLGILLASLCKSRAQVNGVTILVVLTMSALGGSWWPLYIEPEWMQRFAHITITAWAMDGFNSLLIYGKTISSIIPSVSVLMFAGTFFFIAGIHRFKKSLLS